MVVLVDAFDEADMVKWLWLQYLYCCTCSDDWNIKAALRFLTILTMVGMS
jgi:hypothetical protein